MMKKVVLILLGMIMGADVWATDEYNRHQLQQQYKLEQQQQEQKLLQDTTLLERQTHSKTFTLISDEVSLTQAIFVSINQQNWQDVTNYLKRYQQLEYYSPVIVYFAQGSLARAKGKYKQAEQYFRKMMELDTEFVRGRLELARMLFENHKNNESKQQFIQLREQLPHDMQPVIDAYLEAIDYRQGWQSSLSLGWLKNTNVNQKMGQSKCYETIRLSDQEICMQLRSAEQRISDRAWTYNSTLYKQKEFKPQHSLYLKNMMYGTIYDTEVSHSQQTFNTALGYRFQNAKLSFNIAPFYEYYRFSAQSLYNGHGLTMDYSYQPNDKIDVNIQQDYQKNNFKNQKSKENYNGDILSHYLTMSYRLSPKILGFIGVSRVTKKVKDKTNSFEQYAGRLGVHYLFNNRSNLTALAMYRQTNYKAENIFIDPKPAKNKEQNYILSYAIPNFQFKGFYPILGYKYSKMKSNIAWFYDYDAHEMSIKLQKMF